MKKPKAKGLSLTNIKISWFSELADDGWQLTVSASEIPAMPGVYVIFGGGENNRCLYVGQSKNLNKRFQRHSQWARAQAGHEKPHIAYQVIQARNPEITDQELLYAECLMIGLLRPCWNAVTPARISALPKLPLSDLEKFKDFWND